jgi:4-hydroxybutyrate CoA-transferase
LRFVESGMRVYIQPGCAEPETLVEALMRRGPVVRDVEIVHMMTMGVAPYVAPEMAGHFRHNAVFIGPNVREAINDGRADYTPIYLSEIEELFESGAMPIDVALVEVSPPDSHGYCSFGVGVDTTLTAAKCARYVVAQVNDYVPRTYGIANRPSRRNLAGLVRGVYGPRGSWGRANHVSHAQGIPFEGRKLGNCRNGP